MSHAPQPAPEATENPPGGATRLRCVDFGPVRLIDACVSPVGGIGSRFLKILIFAPFLGVLLELLWRSNLLQLLGMPTLETPYFFLLGFAFSACLAAARVMRAYFRQYRALWHLRSAPTMPGDSAAITRATLEWSAFGKPVAQPRDIARQLVLGGCARCLVRVRDDEWCPLPRPLSLAFEPVDLHADGERISLLLGNTEPWRLPLWNDSLRGARRYDWPGLVMAVILLAAVLVSLSCALQGLRRGFFGIAAQVGLALYLIAWVVSRGELRPSPCCFAVPGGLVIRGRRGATLFERDRSVLVLREIAGGGWRAVVTDGRQTYETRLPAASGDLLTRTWLGAERAMTPEELEELK